MNENEMVGLYIKRHVTHIHSLVQVNRCKRRERAKPKQLKSTFKTKEKKYTDNKKRDLPCPWPLSTMAIY